MRAGVVHYGNTHGYDKDQLRHNAWPYQDYGLEIPRFRYAIDPGSKYFRNE